MRKPTEGFWEETVIGVANVLVKVETAWYGENAADYATERRNLEKYTRCWKYGLAATAFLFVNFRVTGSKRFIRWREGWMQNRGWNSNTTKLGKDQQLPHMEMGYLERKREREVKEALESMKIITDLLVSLSVGTSGTLLLLHAEEDSIRQDFESAPLVSGRSVVAEEMCSKMVSVADSLPPEDRRGDDANMKSFQNFITNCKKREKFEQDFRALCGKLEEEPVVIPENAL